MYNIHLPKQSSTNRFVRAWRRPWKFPELRWFRWERQ